MKAENEATQDSWEEGLRSAAPALPPALRGRTLARCAVEMESRHRKFRGHRLLKWAFVGVCIVHWATGAVLDSQRAALMAGAGGNPPSGALLADRGWSDPAEVRSSLQARSRVMGALMARQGEWPSNTGAG